MKGMDKKKIAALFLVFLLLAVYQDCTSGNLEADNTISREDADGEEKEVHLILDGEDIVKDYPYELEIEAARITKEEADTYFSRAVNCIMNDFQAVGEEIPLAETYEEGMVEAKWDFGKTDCINSRGEILQEKVPETGIVVNAEVTLSCGNYEQMYGFPFRIEKKVLSEKEQLLQSLEEWMKQQMDLEGTDKIQLPAELNGIQLEWSEEKDSLTLQVLVLELAAVVFLWWGQKKQSEQEEKKRVLDYELDYPDLVNQLSILLETGMTTRQAWGRIAAQYELKRKNQSIEEKPVFEKILYLNRRLSEGENERTAYQKFADEINVRCYYRLIRSLSSNLEKGTAGLCVQLEEECRQAYEQRILIAKRMGEEASTKMLIPLMCMMVLVMAIVLLPAILGMTI